MPSPADPPARRMASLRRSLRAIRAVSTASRGHPPTRVGAVVVSGGRSAGHHNTPDRSWLPLAGRSMLARTLAPLATLPGITAVTVIIDEADRPHFVTATERELPGFALEPVTAEGPPARSIHLALERLMTGHPATDVVVLLDTAWPLASRHLLHEVVAAARTRGAAVPCLPRAPDIWVGDADVATLSPLDRNDVVVQMPQAFDAAELLRQFRADEELGYPARSPLELHERHSGRRARAVPGESGNIHVVTAEDLLLAESLFARWGFPQP